MNQEKETILLEELPSSHLDTLGELQRLMEEPQSSKNHRPIYDTYRVNINPQDGITRARYEGESRLRLNAASREYDYQDSRWYTMAQIEEKGYRIKSKNPGVRMEQTTYDVQRNHPSGKPVAVMQMNEYYLFNADQLEGPGKSRSQVTTPDNKTAAIADSVIQSLETPIRFNGRFPHYSQEEDLIQMPRPGAYSSMEMFLYHALSLENQARMQRNGENIVLAKETSQMAAILMMNDLGISSRNDGMSKVISNYSNDLEKGLSSCKEVKFTQVIENAENFRDITLNRYLSHYNLQEKWKENGNSIGENFFPERKRKVWDEIVRETGIAHEPEPANQYSQGVQYINKRITSLAQEYQRVMEHNAPWTTKANNPILPVFQAKEMDLMRQISQGNQLDQAKQELTKRIGLDPDYSFDKAFHGYSYWEIAKVTKLLEKSEKNPRFTFPVLESKEEYLQASPNETKSKLAYSQYRIAELQNGKITQQQENTWYPSKNEAATIIYGGKNARYRDGLEEIGKDPEIAKVIAFPTSKPILAKVAESSLDYQPGNNPKPEYFLRAAYADRGLPDTVTKLVFQSNNFSYGEAKQEASAYWNAETRDLTPIMVSGSKAEKQKKELLYSLENSGTPMDKQHFHALSIPENRREKIVIDLKNHNLEPTTSLVGSIYMVQRLSGIDYTLNDINGMIEKNKRNLLPSVANPFITGIIQECQVIRTLQENNASYGFERFSEKSIEAFKTLHQEAGIDYDLSKVGELWKEQQQNAFRYKASTKSFSEISIEEAVRTISRECFWPSVTDVSITKYGYRPTEELKDAIATMRWETGFQYGIPGMNKLLEKQEERLANVPFQNRTTG